MRNRNLLLLAAFFLSVTLAAGCGVRQLTKSEMDRADAIAAKIAQAEKMDARDCAPKELAVAYAELDHARHEAAEHHEEAEKYFGAAEKAADALLAKTRPCWEAKQPKPAPAPGGRSRQRLRSWARPEWITAASCPWWATSPG